MKKRLKKDLPFGNINAGSVLTQSGKSFTIKKGDTIYESGSRSHNGITVFEDVENEIISLIWDNDKWFENSELTHVDIKAETNKITIEFKHLDLEDAQYFAKGIQHVMINYLENGSYVWNKFKNFTSIIK